MPALAKLVLLSVALAAISKAAPTEAQARDPCTVLANTSQEQLTYRKVAQCYHAIDFDPKAAKSTLDTLTTFYDELFVFKDISLTPKSKEPFSSPAVDWKAGFKRIRKRQYKRDFDFHNDLTKLANSYNDAHTAYAPTCYTSHLFVQPLSLYAPVVNGRQTVRVFKDLTKSGLQDCEVTRINGRAANRFIQKWADKNTGFSSDPGVRFNHALASPFYWADTKTWVALPGMFSLRYRLPETAFFDYELKCGDVETTRRFRGEWQVISLLEEGSFTDKTTYVSNICAHESSKPVATGSKRAAAKAIDPSALSHIMGILYELEHGTKPDTSLKDLPDAKLWASGNTAAYQLKSMPHVGVLVIPSMEMNSTVEIPAIQGYLTQLAKNGVTNIIIDMSNNFGGEEVFASLLPSVFFKTEHKAPHAHAFRFRVTPAIQAIADANLKNKDIFSYWNPTLLADLKTFTPYTTNPFTTKIENITYGGRTSTYSQLVYGDYDLSIADPSITYPWSNDASKITILTDGQCGSACGMSSDFFVRVHGVKAIAVGGFKDKVLSMFSFPGASVIDTDGYVDTFEKLGVKSTIERLPYSNSASIGVSLVYLENDTLPFEFSAHRFPAALRMDYTPETARHHDKLWAAVAKAVWK